MKQGFQLLCGWFRLALLLGLAPCLAASAAEGNSLDGFRALLTTYLNSQPLTNAQFGLHVVSLQTGATLYSTNAHRLLRPASNTKLFTAALALEQLGPDFRFQTDLSSESLPTSNGTVNGNLYVYGRGDPTFAPRFHNGNYSAVLARLVSALTNSGVRKISGDLVLDSSWFFGPPQGSSWLWDDLESGYGTATSALTVYDNVIDFIAQPAKKIGEPVALQILPATGQLRIDNRAGSTPAGSKSDFNWRRPFDDATLHLEGGLPMDVTMRPGSVSAPSPEALFGEQLRRQLAAARITIHGRTRFVDYKTPAAQRPDYRKLQLLAASTSAPLSEILPFILKPSQNLYAETLFLTAGKAWQTRRGLTDSGGQLGITTEQRAAAALRDFAKSLGFPEGEFYLEEGSGLSRNNLITPYALVELLRTVKSKPYASVLEAALPIAGVDGTLVNRFKGSLAQGNVRAKTGTLLYLSSLSGYCTTAAQEPLAFSFIINSYIPSDGRPTAPAIIDELVKLLCRYKGGSTDAR